MKRLIAAAMALTFATLSPATAMGIIPDVPSLWPAEGAFDKPEATVTRALQSTTSPTPATGHDR